MPSTPAAAAFLVDAALKGTVVLLMGFALARGLRRASAAGRHALWLLTLSALLGVPLVSYLMPGSLSLFERKITFNAPEANKSAMYLIEEPDQTAPELAEARPAMGRHLQEQAAAASPGAPTDGVPGESAARLVAQPLAVPLGFWIVWTWLAGVVVTLAWLLGGWLSLIRLGRSCERVEVGRLAELLRDVTTALKVRRRVILLVTGERAIPMTWGVSNPMVVLPAEAHQWTDARIRMVLTHEVGHIRRWDCLAQLLGQVTQGLYWYHPLAWLAVRRLRSEQEQASDDLVLGTGVGAPDYAEHLLAVTAGWRAPTWMTPLALGMGRAERLHRRLASLLDARRNHQPARGRALAWTGALMLAVTVGLGSLALPYLPSPAHAQQPALPTGAATPQKPQPEATPKPIADPAPTAKETADKEQALLKRLAEVRAKLAKHSVIPLDDRELTEQAVKGLLKGLNDPYADYFSPKERGDLEGQLAGKISGIGTQLQMVKERLVVTTPLEGSPALKAGIRPGDTIEAIDGKATRGMAMQDAVQRILGPAGSVVKLKVVHPEGVVEELAITRGAIRLRTVLGFRRDAEGRWQFMLDPERKIGYVAIKQFTHGTAREVREAIVGLQKGGLKGLILDLRFCPGGLLDEALKVCKLFIGEGLLLTTQGQGKEKMVFRADGASTLGTFPMLVLVNEQTASAAEIVAGALRDHGRAVVLGTRTFGKGSVQTIVLLEGGAALKVTTAYHYLPSGRNIQKRPGQRTWGVDPSSGFYVLLTPAQTAALHQDVEKRAILEPKKDPAPPPLTPQRIETDHADPQLAAALRSMTARLTGGEFLKVGGETGQLDQALHLEEIRNRRARLLQGVQDLDREIADLQQGATGEKGK